MMTIKISIPLFVGLTTIHLINSVGGFFFTSNEKQQQPQLSSSEDAFGGSLTTVTMSSSMKSEQLLEQRLADVRFHFNCSRKVKCAV